METEATIFVVDDDAVVLRSLGSLLHSAGYRVELFLSPRDFLVRAACQLRGCIVLDLRMPGMSGLEVQQELARAGCTLPIVFLSGDSDVAATVRAMKAGAIDFLCKPVTGRELLDAVASAIEREVRESAKRAERRGIETRFGRLTRRERQVCERVAQGRLNKQIADELGTVEKTIKVHRGRVMRKLGVHSVAELVRLVDRLHEP